MLIPSSLSPAPRDRRDVQARYAQSRSEPASPCEPIGLHLHPVKTSRLPIGLGHVFFKRRLLRRLRFA